MEDPDECAIPMEPVIREKSRTVPIVNLEERGKNLLKIAQNSDHDQANNLKDLNEELKGLLPEEMTRLWQTRDENENTILHCAAKSGNLTICQLIVSAGADINATGQNGMKVLPFAARYGEEKRAKEVWDCMSWIATQISSKGAAENFNLGKSSSRRIAKQSSKVLPKEEVVFNVREKDQYNFTILHHAIQNTNWVSNPDVVEKLISTGNFPITESDNQGNTCLHLAAQLDKRKDDKILDTFFANENIPVKDISACIKRTNDRGMTPLHIACQVGNQDSLRELLLFCQKNSIMVEEILHLPDKKGSTPLCHAIKCKNVEMVNSLLLQKGAIVTKESLLTAAR